MKGLLALVISVSIAKSASNILLRKEVLIFIVHGLYMVEMMPEISLPDDTIMTTFPSFIVFSFFPYVYVEISIITLLAHTPTTFNS